MSSACEPRFRTMIEKSAFGVFLAKAGVLTYANPKMAEIFGYSLDEMMAQKHVRELVLDADWPAVEQHFTRFAVSSGESINCHFRGRTKSGEVIYVAVHGARTEDADGACVVYSLLDVTPLIEAQGLVEKELTKFQVLYDLALAMTADRGLEENLSMVVEKSRQLFRTDTAFTVLKDDRTGEAAIHTESGIKTEAFRSLRTPFGEGLGGKVALTGKGQILQDYSESLSPSIRQIVREEGLVSGVAVPIQTQQENVGVLYIFNRSRTSFTKEDLDTLSLLGNLAAVEITRKRTEDAMREGEQRYRSVMEAVPDPIVVYMGGKITYLNPAFTRVFGWTLEELSSRNQNYLPSGRRPDTEEMLETVTRQAGFYGFETRRKNKSGELIDIHVSAELLRGRDGSVVGSVIALQDITERKRAEEEVETYKKRLEELLRKRTAEAAELAEANKKLSLAVKEQEQRTRELTLLHHMGELLQACRKEHETFKIVGSICTQLFPATSGYLCILDESRTSLEIVAWWGDPPPADANMGFDHCWALRLGKVHSVEDPSVELVCLHVDAAKDFMSVCTPVTAQGEVLGMLHVRWNTEKSTQSDESRRSTMQSVRGLVVRLVEHYALSLVTLRLRESLTRQSIRDPLTGLFNRRYMEESLEREVRRAERRATSLGIMMLDVDRFKDFNDLLGHEAGDIVLRRLGSYLSRNIRGEDIACRYGGEEFTVIMPDATMEDVLRRAENIREGAKEELKISHGGKIYGVTISIGVAAFPEHGPSAQDALVAADAALYRAKADGRDRVASALIAT